MSGEFKMPGLLPVAKQKKFLEKPEDESGLSSSADSGLSKSGLSDSDDTSEKSTSNLSPTGTDDGTLSSAPAHQDKQRDREPPKSRDQLLQEKQAKYAEILSSLKYQPPEGVASSSADSRYSFEVLKNGTIVDRFKFSRLDNKGFYVVGRVPGCDVTAENPTVSRTHAILQFISCPVAKGSKKKGQDDPGRVGNGEAGIPDRTGLYLFDLNSTHGTYINKNQALPSR